MNKKRLIITSTISIILVSILLIGSTYSIFTTTEVDESANIYKTGNLDVTYTLSNSNVTLANIIPKTIEEADTISPYRITVTNNGNVAYMFDVILNDTTSSEESTIDYQYIMTRVGYLEPKALSECPNRIIKEDIILPAGESVEIDVRVWLDNTLSNSEISKSFYAKLAIDGLAVYNDHNEINNDILSLRYMNIEETSTIRSMQYLAKIKKASFVNYIDTSKAITNTNNEVISWDLSSKKDNSIIAWLENNEEDNYYNLYIGSNQKIYSTSLNSLFYGMSALEEIEFDNLSTSLTKDMSSMFSNCSSLTNLDVSNFLTNNVENMSNMFSGCSNLTKLDLNNFNTKNVIDMQQMFNNCYKLTTAISISNPNTLYTNIFNEASIEKETSITINYTANTSNLVDDIISAKSNASNITKGKLV